MEKSSYTVGSLQVCVFKTREGLLIEAENKSNNVHYTFKATNDVVPALTNHLFDGVDELYGGLLKALNNPSSEAQLSMIEDGKLEFIQKKIFGDTEEQFSFIILLEEIGLESREKMKEQIELLLMKQADSERNQEEMKKKIEELEGKVAIQNNHEIKLLKTIEELSSQFRRFEESMIERQVIQENKILDLIGKREGLEPVKNSGQQSFKPDLCFDPNCENKDIFTFSNENKTLVSTYGKSAWFGALALQPLSPSGKQEFSVRIESSSKYIMVGIASGKLRNSQHYYSGQGSFLFSCHDNGIHLNQTQFIKSGFSQAISRGSVITVIVDFDTNEITFCLNYTEKFNKSISHISLKDEVFYPCVDLWFKAGVTFI